MIIESHVVVIAGIVAWLGLGSMAAGHAIMFKRDARGSALWTIIAFTLPLLGPWLYWVLGINRVKRRAIKLRAPVAAESPAAIPTDHALTELDVQRALGHLARLKRVTDRLSRFPLLAGNTVNPLHDGDEAYPAMLAAIESATRSVTLASYIFEWDDVGRRFTDVLGSAANRGVKVHVLLDGIGAVEAYSRVGRRLIRAGAEVAAFFPLRIPTGRLRLNLRNHRKIMVVDGRVGFTGGMNISQKHCRAAPRRQRAEDLHFGIKGPVVAELQAAFVEDWYLGTDKILDGDAYFPALTPDGPAQCRGICSGPDDPAEPIHWTIQAALSAAIREVVIVTPYFIPSPALIAGMAIASMRGIAIRLVLPSRVDRRFMRWAADAYLWQVLVHGVRVYHRPPPFVHTKLMIVDRQWVFLGSANLDPRSFRLNFEFNVEVYDAGLGGRLAAWLDDVLNGSREVTLEMVDGRSMPVRLRDGMVKLFSPYL
ncbi:MAG: cardiolipin synthase [Phycisphaerales bacterium]|nr:cardiolipin synthase [Phycisphaerales bacterium]